MKSTRKTPRTSKTTHLVNRDRLSNLPKDILHYILSFLETREVIRLSELSRRWRRVWASMPYLNFEQSSFDSAESFSDFLWLVLLFRDVSDIKRFRLSCEGYREDGIPVHVLKTLLLVVKNRGVVVLDLDIATFQYQYDNNFQLLSCFADCRSLPEINLRLFDYSQLSCIDSMSFTMLKTLHIEKSQFYQGVTYREKLVLCCPHLENFLLKNCNMLNLKVIDIEAVNLKNLKFMNTSKYPFRGELKISAPNLRCLSYLGPTLKGYSFQNLSSLNKALIHHFTERVNNEEDGCFLLSLVCALYNAEVLYLSSHFAPVYKNHCCILICFILVQVTLYTPSVINNFVITPTVTYIGHVKQQTSPQETRRVACDHVINCK